MQTPRTVRTFALALSLAAAPLAAQSFDQVNQSAEKDLDQALERLSEVRENIAGEKAPLVQEISRLEEKVREKRREFRELKRLRDNRESSLKRLRETVKATREQNDYVAGLLDEFVRSFETRINFSETQVYGDVAKEGRLAMDDADLSQAEQFERQMDVVATAVDRLDKLLGGYVFEGKALLPGGDVAPGQFAVFGPSVYYAAQDRPFAGISYNKLNAARAAVALPAERFRAGIDAFVTRKEGTIPADPTLGKALKIEKSQDTLFQHLQKGGVVGWIIVALGLLSALIGLFKIFDVARFKVPSEARVRGVLDKIGQGDLAAARSEAGAVSGPGGEMLATGVDQANEKRGTLEEMLYEKILKVRPTLERFLPFMAITAAAAPLLGLLGTVTGMIKTFNLITIFGTGDAKSLSSGISEALVTTELGLIVAIPALILHGLLQRMVRRKLSELEQTAVGFINGVVGARGSNSEDAA